MKAFRKLAGAVILGNICLLLPQIASAQEDPPSRVARLNYLQGEVSMLPAGLSDWSPAQVNRPFTIGDYLYTGEGGQAELHMDTAVIRMASQTSFGFLNLDDQNVQIKLTAGNMYFHIRNVFPNQVFEVDTPNAAFTLLRAGNYRFDVAADGSASFVVVRQGQLEITGGGQAFTLNPGNSVNLSGTDQISYDVGIAPAPDEFDSWCSQRDYREARLESVRYVPEGVIGYEDLDSNGEWETVPNYGPVWYPRRVVSGWAPYRYGHWEWVQPWGWTWIDDAAWGFAPFHYGRWAYMGDRWGWCPGPRVSPGYGPVVRAHYAPALVAFFGGSHWGVSLSIGGGGPSLGWVPLGFGEVYRPPYRVSQNYFRNVNVSNTIINRNVNITNVYNTTYVNKTTNVTVINNNQRYVNMSAPGAVTAMPQNAFAGGRSVAQSSILVTPAQVARIQPQSASVLVPPAAPTRTSVAPGTPGFAAVHPMQQVMARQVVAKQQPPPVRTSFAAQQSFVQQHPGQPINFAAVPRVAPIAAATSAVRQAPPASAAVAVSPVPHNVSPVPRSASPAESNRPPERYNAPPAPPARQPAVITPVARPYAPPPVNPANRTIAPPSEFPHAAERVSRQQSYPEARGNAGPRAQREPGAAPVPARPPAPAAAPARREEPKREEPRKKESPK